MAEPITSDTIQEAIKIDFHDNKYLRQIKTCIQQDQQQFFIIICQGLESNLKDGELTYRFQTLRLSKILVELKNDQFNYHHFSINVLPVIVEMTTEQHYSVWERNQDSEKKTIISLIQLSLEVIRGWAHLFPQIPDMEGEASLSEFLKTYLQMLEQKIAFPLYEYYPLQLIQTHTHPNYNACQALWKKINQQQLIETKDFQPPGGGEQSQRDLKLCQQLLVFTQEQLNYIQNNYKLLEEKVKKQKEENCDLFKQLMEEKKKKRHSISDPKENQLLIKALENQNLETNEDNIQLRNQNSELEKRAQQIFNEMGKMQDEFQNQMSNKNLEIINLKQKIQELNLTLLDQFKNQELLSGQLQHYRKSLESTSTENLSLVQHKLEIEAKKREYEQKLQAKEQEIKKLLDQIKDLNQQGISQSQKNSQKTSEFQYLNENYIKTITEQQQEITNLSDQILESEKQILNLNTLNQKIIREKNLLQQEIESQIKKSETRQLEQEETVKNLQKQCSILQEKLTLEKDAFKLISAASPSNGLKIKQLQHSVVDFNTLQHNHLQSQRLNGFRSLNQSVMQPFRHSDFQSDSPTKVDVSFPEKFDFNFVNQNETSRSKISQSIKLNLIKGNCIFHTDNYFQFARQTKIQDQKLYCRIYLKNIYASQIRDLNIKFNCTLNNLQFQSFTSANIKSDLISGEQISFLIKEISISEIIQKRLGIIIQIQSLNFKSYQIQMQLALTQLINYHQTSQREFLQHWTTGVDAINNSEFQYDQKTFQNAIAIIHASIPNTLLMNNQLGLFGSIDEYWFCCKIQYSEQDNKIKIILKDLSNNNEITRKLLIGYTELFSE